MSNFTGPHCADKTRCFLVSIRQNMSLLRYNSYFMWFLCLLLTLTSCFLFWILYLYKLFLTFRPAFKGKSCIGDRTQHRICNIKVGKVLLKGKDYCLLSYLTCYSYNVYKNLELTWILIVTMRLWRSDFLRLEQDKMWSRKEMQFQM